MILRVITVSFTIHPIVRYRKHHAQRPVPAWISLESSGNDCSMGARSKKIALIQLGCSELRGISFLLERINPRPVSVGVLPSFGLNSEVPAYSET
jgi:hypothetical protein